MGRKKGRSGRKCSREMAHARELIATVVPDVWCREIIDRLAGMALGDDGLLAVEGARLIFLYAYGPPE